MTWRCAALVALAACGDNGGGKGEAFVWNVQGTPPDLVSFRDGGTWAVIEPVAANGLTTYSFPPSGDFGVFYTCAGTMTTRELEGTATSAELVQARLGLNPCGGSPAPVMHHVTANVLQPGTVFIGFASQQSTLAPWMFAADLPEGVNGVATVDMAGHLSSLPAVDLEQDMDLGDLAIPSIGAQLADRIVTVEGADPDGDMTLRVFHDLPDGIGLADDGTVVDAHSFHAPFYPSAAPILAQEVFLTAPGPDGPGPVLEGREVRQVVNDDGPVTMQLQDEIADGVAMSHDAYAIDIPALPITPTDFETFYFSPDVEQGLYVTGDFVELHGLTTLAVDTDIAGYDGSLDPPFDAVERYLQVDTQLGTTQATNFIVDNTGVTSASPRRGGPAAAASRARPTSRAW